MTTTTVADVREYGEIHGTTLKVIEAFRRAESKDPSRAAIFDSALLLRWLKHLEPATFEASKSPEGLAQRWLSRARLDGAIDQPSGSGRGKVVRAALSAKGRKLAGLSERASPFQKDEAA